MKPDVTDKDIITERQYNRSMADSSTDPQEDSPGDSESDAGAEFLMGLNYMPNEASDEEALGDEPGEIAFDASGKRDTVKKKIPSTAKVISSDQPSPWADLEDVTDTH